MIVATLIAVIGSLLGDPATWIERALVVLVCGSPCALAISVPVTVVAAIGAAKRLGALVKGGAAPQALGAVRGVALDKTGTLTANRPTVIDVATTNDATREHVSTWLRRWKRAATTPPRGGDPGRGRPSQPGHRRGRRAWRRADRPPRRTHHPGWAGPAGSSLDHWRRRWRACSRPARPPCLSKTTTG